MVMAKTNIKRHCITWSEHVPDRSQLAEALIPYMQDEELRGVRGDLTLAVSEIAYGHMPARWHNCKYDVARASMQWPAVVFSVDCVNGDGAACRTFIRDGRSYSEDFVPPAFDIEKFMNTAKSPLPPMSRS